MSSSSPMTTLTQRRGHWDARLPCRVVLTTLCKFSRSEQIRSLSQKFKKLRLSFDWKLLLSSFFMKTCSLPTYSCYIQIDCDGRFLLLMFLESDFWLKFLKIVLKLSHGFKIFWKLYKGNWSGACVILLAFRQLLMNFATLYVLDLWSCLQILGTSWALVN